MGAPIGNCNAAKNKSACASKTGKSVKRESAKASNWASAWTKRVSKGTVSSGAKKYLTKQIVNKYGDYRPRTVQLIKEFKRSKRRSF